MAYADETMAGYTRRQSTQPGQPGSRNGSRPPSRTGSNLSLDYEEEARGSGVRRTSSMRSGASAGRPPYRHPAPVGFGSSTPRKTSTPVTNGSKGRTPSNSSMDRTPMPTSGSSIQRSGSGLSDNRRTTAKTTTSYGADGSRLTTTTSTSSYAYDASSAGQQSQNRNW